MSAVSFFPVSLHLHLNCHAPQATYAQDMAALDTTALAGIALYQRWLSPHKGFRCAHAAFYGGASCSSAIAQAIRTEGLSLSTAAARLAACRQAYGHLQVTGARVRGVCCCGPLPMPFRCG